MNLSRVTPKAVAWTGIGMAAGGALLIVLLPTVFYPLVYNGDGSGQWLLLGLELILRVATVLLPPLGSALIAASVVMMYIDKREESRVAPDTRHQILSGSKTTAE